jgi:hypothetical protein
VKYGIAFLNLALAILVISPLTAIAEQSEGGIPMSSGSAQFSVHHVLLAQLGEEHLANAVLRRGTKGEHIVCWGDRILQWDVAESAEMVEVFSPIPGFQYSNGGCIMDVDGDGEMVHLIVRPDEQDEARVSVVCYTNCESVELLHEGKSMGEKVPSDSQERTAEWNLPIPWTTLKAIGKSGGESICHHELKRPGDAEKLIMRSDRDSLKADGRDVAHIEVNVTDGEGNMVSDGGKL